MSTPAPAGRFFTDLASWFAEEVEHLESLGVTTLDSESARNFFDGRAPVTSLDGVHPFRYPTLKVFKKARSLRNKTPSIYELAATFRASQGAG